MSSDRKVFSEQEVTAVVRRAVELQEMAGKEDYTPGVTPEELQRIANELGIEAKYLQQAINEADSPEVKTGPLHLTEEFERVVDSELDPEDYDVLLKYLRPTSNHTSFNQVGRTLSGTTWTGCSMARVEVTSKKGRTRVHVRSNSVFAWLVSLHPASIGSLMTLAALGSKGHIWLALAIFAIVMSVAWIAFQALSKKGHKAARKLTDNLAQTIAEANAAKDVRSNLAASSPAIAPDKDQSVQVTG